MRVVTTPGSSWWSANGRLITAVVGSLAVAYSLLVTTTTIQGRVSFKTGVAALIAPYVAIVGAVRPAWLIYGLLALPAAIPPLAPLRSPVYWLGVMAAVALWEMARFRTRPALPVALLPFVLLITLALFHRAEVGAQASLKASQLIVVFAYYLLLAFVSFRLVSSGRLAIPIAGIALIAGALIGEVYLLVVHEGDLGALSRGGIGEGGYATLQGRAPIAYASAMGFAAAAALALHSWSRRWLRVACAIAACALLVLVGLTYVRGAILGCLLVLILVLVRVRRSPYLIGLTALVVLLMSIDTVNERLVRGAEGSIGTVVTSSEFSTGRVTLWNALLEQAEEGYPWGGGFGYVWSLDADTLVESGNWGGGSYVYPHNDFVFAAVELGYVGPLLLLAFWLLLALSFWRAGGLGAAHSEAIVCLGVILVMVPSELFGNGLLVALIAERFFAFAGMLIAIPGPLWREQSAVRTEDAARSEPR